MNTSAAIAETEVRIPRGTLSSRHDRVKDARPRKRGGDAPGRGRTGVQAGGLATQSVNILFKDASLPRGLSSEACFAHSQAGGVPRLAAPRLRVADWAGVHRRTHPEFSGQAPSAVCVGGQRSSSLPSLAGLGCADRGPQLEGQVLESYTLPIR